MLIIGFFSSMPVFATGGDIEGTENNEDYQIHDQADDYEDGQDSSQEDVSIYIDTVSDLKKDINDVNGNIIDVQSDVKEMADSIAENKALIKAVSDNQQEQQSIDYTESFNMIHEDLQKIMISLWCLVGMILGTKLIRGLFGNG